MSVNEVSHVVGGGVLPSGEGDEPYVACIFSVDDTGKLDGKEGQGRVGQSFFVSRGQASPTKRVGEAPTANDGCSGGGGGEEVGPCLGVGSSFVNVIEQTSCKWSKGGGLK